MSDPLGPLTTATTELAQDAATVASDALLARRQFAALAAWVEAEHPGATVSQLVHDPFVSVIVPAQTPTLTSIAVTPTLGWYAKQAGIKFGCSLNINYQGSPDNTYPWDQVYSRGLDEVANVGGLATEEVVFQDRFLVPVVTNTQNITTSFTSADAQVALMKQYGLRPLIYILPNPCYSGYSTAIANAGGTSAAALQMMTTVINAIVGHYAGQADYVVFNELIQFGAYNSNPFVTAMGTSFSTGAVASAIQLINAADPTAKIWLNTNHVETDVVTSGGSTDGVYWTFYVSQAAGLKSANPAFTGVSLESHLVASKGASVYTSIQSRIAGAKSVGLAVAIGELDITDDTGLALGPGGQAARDALAAQIVSTYVTNFCAGGIPDHLICWQLTDGSSWLASPPQGIGSSPYDRQAHTTDGDAFTIGGTTYYAHTPTPTGAAITPVGNGISMTVTPAIPGGGIAGGTSVTFTRGLTGSTFGFTGSLTTNGTQAAGNTLSLIATTMSGVVQPGTQGRHTIGFDTSGNAKAAYYALQQQLLAALGGVIPSTQTITTAGGTQRYFVIGLDQVGRPMVTQPSLLIHSNNTGVATVPNNQTIGLASLPGTFLATSNGTGTATISASATNSLGQVITSNAMSLVVNINSGSTNEPTGMTTVLNTGPMTQAPSQVHNGTWNEGPNPAGGAQITTTMTNFTQPPGNPAYLSLNPSGSGLLFTFPTSLPGGNEPAFAYAPFSLAGVTQTGWLYYRYDVTFSANFTLNGNSAQKINYLAPVSGNATNDFLGAQVDQRSAGQVPLYLVMEQQGSVTNNLPTGDIGAGFESQEGPLPAVGGKWTLEVVIQPETTPGAGNGSYYQWCNGQLLYKQLGTVKWYNAGETPGFLALKLQPVYGGGTNSPPAVLTMLYDNLYASVK